MTPNEIVSTLEDELVPYVEVEATTRLTKFGWKVKIEFGVAILLVNPNIINTNEKIMDVLAKVRKAILVSP